MHNQLLMWTWVLQNSNFFIFSIHVFVTVVKTLIFWERIIVFLDWQFVAYTEGAGVDEDAGLDEGDVFYTGSLFNTGTLFCRDTGIEEGSSQCRRWNIIFRCRCRQSRAAGRGRARYILAGRMAGLEVRLYAPNFLWQKKFICCRIMCNKMPLDIQRGLLLFDNASIMQQQPPTLSLSLKLKLKRFFCGSNL